jgi:hypothetical protein
VLGSDAALSNTVRVAGLASALTSLVKRAVQLTRLALATAAEHTLESDSGATSPNFTAAVPCLFQQCFFNFAPAQVETVVSLTSSSGSGSSRQAAASLALLVVLLSRSLVQLAHAMEAAGPQLLFDCMTAQTTSTIAWAANMATAISFKMLPFDHTNSGAQGCWIQWQVIVLTMFEKLLVSLQLLGMAPATGSRAAASATGSEEIAAAAAAASSEAGAAAADSKAAAAAAAAAGVPNSDLSGTASAARGQPDNSSSSGACSSSSAASAQVNGSSSSSEHVKWSYLLHLQESDPQWAAATAGFASHWHAFDWSCLNNQIFTTAPAAQLALQVLYEDALQLCRTLTDVAPITVVCNNPSCQNLACVREAASACKACTGCGCRYCSELCQRADWKRHKPACKRMAAAGQTCA